MQDKISLLLRAHSDALFVPYCSEAVIRVQEDERLGGSVLVYDRPKCLSSLSERFGCSEEEASEYLRKTFEDIDYLGKPVFE